MIYLGFITSLVASIFLSISLKALSFFHFIKWNPIGYAKRLQIFESSHPLYKWFFLTMVIFVTILIFYFIMQYVQLVPAFLTSLVIGGVIALISEWVIYSLPAELSSFKKLSVPFMVTVIITARFVFETAQFHYMASGERNQLPYKDTMIK